MGAAKAKTVQLFPPRGFRRFDLYVLYGFRVLLHFVFARSVKGEDAVGPV